MTVDTIIEQAGIPLLLLVICVYYAIRLIVLHDVATAGKISRR